GAASGGSLEAKLEYCKTCHGLSGQGYRGYFPMPRLAGQQPQYLENQLRAFIERRRTNPIMANVAHVLSPSMVSALAAHFK
ncbi:c-type cytochrome, partial [Raoultella ornithinolytica]|uniref:c-type cytochrome n=2 Tax=Pseudomonadota TaxID=1224 RepID=UPI0013DD383F